MSLNNKSNYTPEMVTELKNMYADLGNEGLPKIAKHFDKPIKSIRSKLCTEKVYVATSKTYKKSGYSKKEILKEIESHDFDVSGFENATKDALNRLLTFIVE